MKAIHQKLRITWGKLLRRLLGAFGVTSLAFVFQACYAPYYSAEYDRCINGEVLSAQTHEPIKGVKVSGNNQPNYVTTDSVGRFHIHLPIAETYTITFNDLSNTVDAYLPKDTVVSDVHYKGEKITIYLNQP